MNSTGGSKDRRGDCRRRRCRRRLQESEATRRCLSARRRSPIIVRQQRADQKIKKSKDSITLTLERTPDVLSEVAASRANGMLVIGFAAETENVLDNAREKLRSKNLDAIIANDVSACRLWFRFSYKCDHDHHARQAIRLSCL